MNDIKEVYSDDGTVEVHSFYDGDHIELFVDGQMIWWGKEKDIKKISDTIEKLWR